MMAGGSKKKMPGGGLYKMMAGGTMKKATNADMVKAMGMGGAKKPNAGAVRMAKGILKRAGMKAIPAAYGKKVVRKKK